MSLVEKFSGSRFWSIYRQMGNHSLDRQQHQTAMAVKLLEHARKHVQFWKDRLSPLHLVASTDFAQTFSKVPISTKQDLRSGFPDFVTALSLKQQWRFGNTSGTVDRITTVSDFQKRDYLRATNLRMVHSLLGNPLAARIVEVPPDACNVVCALRDEGPLDLWNFVWWASKKGLLLKPETRPDLRGRIERTLIIRQDTLEPLEAKPYQELIAQLDHQLDRIVQANPNIVRGLPLFLLWLSHRASERGLRFPSLRCVLPYGGMMTSSMANRVSQGFGAPFFDYYGTSEIGGIGMQCPSADSLAPSFYDSIGLKLFDDLVLIEILDEFDQPLPPGQIGKIVVTDYHNYAMPIIRYEIGDMGMWISHHLTTSNQWQLNREARLLLHGRRMETSRFPSGRWITVRNVMEVLFQDPAVLNACVEVQSSRKRFRVATSGMGDIDPQTLLQLQDLLESEEPVAHRRVGYLRPENSGKYCGLKIQ